MIDILTILCSTLAVLFVAVRAWRLDRTRPWFDPAAEASFDRGSEEPAARRPAPRPGRR